MEREIIHLPEKNRFEYQENDRIAFVEYVQTAESLDIKHTFVPNFLEGQGIASALVKAAYDYALTNGLKPKATCSYAVTWLQRHPEYQKE
ncbi:GNAT family N-acetyltransferase [Parabacteroides sp. Marseille-P3160]|uniref:GNAT family N-acetyltransferase n=1 Tax=Parabacteroides sp. Marseille-P3160 TaxID=1917887 RepID=UPI0009BC713D|nr:GNAT family N-acetyltransferase [Parabacteroides sp. Marseille-P3160]